MLKIRLQRVGRKHEPAFRLVLTDSKNATKSGRFNEILGSYDPRKENDEINADRVKHWLSLGAQPTDTVHNLLVTHKVIEGGKKNVLPKKTYTSPAENAVAEEAPKEDKVQEEPAEAQGEESAPDEPQEDNNDKIEETADKQAD